ncbi:MAG TPA: hypothetical protein VGX25_32960 [Actinophytocola sp.]|uniref:phage shock envelope stress response protein PspM n=1 Tax=Actinophytocola sp. TaxID=1872138 RepID=UPI002DDD0CE4|nr:hypothetical protein [Actinophytocola sp.]HEV2784222.1 hypothetical protein [Actinophytocola sp.]
MGRAGELKRLIALAEQLRGPALQHVQQLQSALARRGDPAEQLERQRRRLARKRAWASRWLAVWSIITAICTVLAVGWFTGVVEDPSDTTPVAAIIIGLISGTFAVRSGLRMRNLGREHRALGAGSNQIPARAPAALPPRGSLAREPMERLAQCEATLAELLVQIGRGGSVPVESVEHTRRTGADAALVLRRVAAQLHAVERARDHAPPLERGPLADAVRALRRQLDEGVDGYGSLVAAAGRVLAASSMGAPNQDLSDATEHLAGLALALRDLSPEGS